MIKFMITKDRLTELLQTTPLLKESETIEDIELVIAGDDTIGIYVCLDDE